MLVDTNVESLEPIQPDTIGASSVVPSSQIEAIPEKGTILASPFILLSTDSILLTRFSYM